MRTTSLAVLFFPFFFDPFVSLAQTDSGEAARLLRAMHFQYDFEGAVAQGKEITTRFTQAPDLRAWYILSLARNQSKEAVAAAEDMLSFAKDSPWAHFALAGALNYLSLRGDEALAASEKVLTLLPQHPDAIWLRAKIFMRQKKYEEAVRFLDSQPAHLKNSAELLATKGDLLYYWSQVAPRDESRLAAAYTAWEEARKTDPTNVSAYYLPGTYLLNARRIPEAYPLLKKSVELSPVSTAIHTNLWRAIMGRRDTTPENKNKEVESDMESFLQRRGSYPGALSSIASYAREFKLPAMQKLAEERILEKFPDSMEAEWVLVYRYRALASEAGEEGLKDPERKERYRLLLREFIKRPRHDRETLLGDAYRQLFFSIKDDTSIGADELLKVAQGMIRYEGINPHSTYTSAAKALAERKVHFREAERIAREGIVEVQKKIESQRHSYTPESYQKTLNWMTGLAYDSLGWVFYNEGRLEDAERELLHADKLDPRNAETLYHLGRLYAARGDSEKEEKSYIEGVSVQRLGENPCEKGLQSFYEKRHGSLDGFKDYRAKIEDLHRGKRRDVILAERLSTPKSPLPFRLKDLDGKELSFDSMKGKSVIVNFWGIWCGPCVKEMPDFQKLHEKYRDAPDVMILTVNNDGNPADVPPWMKKHNYNFNVLLDDGYVNKAEVRAFPTTWFIDSEGQIRFVKVGWTEKLVEEFTWRIEALEKPQDK